MKNYKRDLLVALTSILIVVFGAVTVYGASNVSTVLQAYKGVKIVYNGTTLTSTSEPYIINNTTYVPIRMLMNQFGKDISWDATNQQVIINNSAEEIAKDKQIEDLKNQVTSLNAKIKGLETALGNADTTIRTIDDALNKYKKTSSTTVTTPVNSGTNTSKTLSDMQTNLNKFFADAGDDYFDDDNIVLNINLSGNTVDLYYDITLDCEDADKYDRLTKISQSKIKSLLNIVKSQIASETYGTNYEKANVTGKLSDQDNSSYYVKYSGGTYSFSWKENNMLSDITEYLEDYFKNGGDVYFGDNKIALDFNISGDEDDLKYEIFIDFDNAYDYDDLSEVNKAYVRNFLNKVKTCITSKTDGTDYEDANITGTFYDDDDSDYYVKYTGSSYTFSY